MTIDVSKIKPGDEVWVRGIMGSPLPDTPVRNCGVIFPHPGGPGGVTTHYVQASAIVSHTPRTLQVGDRVDVHAGPAVVVALDGDDAWLRFPNGSRSTYSAKRLERLP